MTHRTIVTCDRCHRDIPPKEARAMLRLEGVRYPEEGASGIVQNLAPHADLCIPCYEHIRDAIKGIMK